MAKTILTDIDLQQNEVQNAVLENRATAPSSPKPGQQYFDTTDNTVKTYNGMGWTSGGGGGESYITLEGNILNVGNSTISNAYVNVTVIGAYNDVKGDDNVIIGSYINAENGTNIAIGHMAGPIISKNSIYMGINCPTNMWIELDGVVVFHVSDQYQSNTTQFYFMGEGTKLANAYCNGEAGFGYVSSSSSGTCKLSSICTENVGSFDPENFEG